MSQSELPPPRYRAEVEVLQIWGTALLVVVAAVAPVWIAWLLWGWAEGLF